MWPILLYFVTNFQLYKHCLCTQWFCVPLLLPCLLHGAESFSVSQEIPRILRKPKVHYRVHKGPSIQSTPSNPTSWRSILILSSHLRLGLPSGLCPSGCVPLLVVLSRKLQVGVIILCLTGLIIWLASLSVYNQRFSFNYLSLLLLCSSKFVFTAIMWKIRNKRRERVSIVLGPRCRRPASGWLSSLAR